MSNLTMKNLTVTKKCLEEILLEKYELENENDLHDSVSYGLNLSIKNLKDVIEIINDRLEDIHISEVIEYRMKNDDGTRYTLEDVEEYIKNRKVKY